MLPFESFSYPFFDLKYTANHAALVGAVLAAPDPHPAGLRALYVHIPFCDSICAFCPFVKSVGSVERVEAYLEALVVEMQTVGATARITGWALDAVYIGGGTPSVLSEAQLLGLFTAIRANFTIKPDAEISFEFEAKSVDESKFGLLKELGVTRVSFGVQTFDPATREMIGITATLEQIRTAIALSTKYFENTNLDMMVGFPGQDLAGALLDAQLAATSGIGSVSIYPVDYVMTLPAWQDRIHDGRLPKPASLAERDDMFHQARAELIKHMAEQNMYCFGSPGAPATRYMFSTLYGGYDDECIGVGTGAYSFLRGLAYYNDATERDYVQRALTGALPIALSSPGHAYEKGLVFFPKRLSFDMRHLAALGLQEVYGPKIDKIISEGLAVLDGHILRLTEAGKLVYSELMASFFSDAGTRIYALMVARLSRDVGVIDAGEWDSGSSRVRAMGAFNALPGGAPKRTPVLQIAAPA